MCVHVCMHVDSDPYTYHCTSVVKYIGSKQYFFM